MRDLSRRPELIRTWNTGKSLTAKRHARNRGREKERWIAEEKKQVAKCWIINSPIYYYCMHASIHFDFRLCLCEDLCDGIEKCVDALLFRLFWASVPDPNQLNKTEYAMFHHGHCLRVSVHFYCLICLIFFVAAIEGTTALWLSSFHVRSRVWMK